MWVGSPSGGLWKTIDGGETWYETTDDLPLIGVSDIAVDPTNPDIIYMATGDADGWDTYSIGLLKSTDGGETWEKSLDWSYDQRRGVWMIKVSPLNPNIVYAATTDGIYKSIDAGSRWSKVSNNIMGTDIDIDPRDDQKTHCRRRTQEAPE